MGTISVDVRGRGIDSGVSREQITVKILYGPRILVIGNAFYMAVLCDLVKYYEVRNVGTMYISSECRRKKHPLIRSKIEVSFSDCVSPRAQHYSTYLLTRVFSKGEYYLMTVGSNSFASRNL
jgi:hypothetical protein